MCCPIFWDTIVVAYGDASFFNIELGYDGTGKITKRMDIDGLYSSHFFSLADLFDPEEEFLILAQIFE